MEKVKFMKITKVVLSNFRSYANETAIDMGDMTMITGDNGKGKSSIAHAIAYAFHGVSAFGVQDIDNIRADENKPVMVTIEFIDQNGELHSLNRTRTGDSTALVLDGHKIQQKNIDSMFCDKDTFLSLLNPSYFIEVMGNKGKDFLSLRLPIVKPDEVFKNLTEYECKMLEGIDLAVPDAQLQNLRRATKDNGESLLSIEGQLEQVGEDIRSGKAKLDECYGEITELEQKITELTEKKNAGINSDELIAEKCIIQDKLGSTDADAKKRMDIENLLLKWDILEYQPKHLTQIAELKATLKSLSGEFNEVDSRVKNLNLGDTCPSCRTEITEGNIEVIRQSLNVRLTEILTKGKEIKNQCQAEEAAEKRDEEAFEKERNDEKQSLNEHLAMLGEQDTPDKRALTARLDEIDELLRVGNLSEHEHGNLCDYEAVMITNKSLIKAIDIKAKEAVFIELTDRKAKLTEESARNAEVIKALQEYIVKRSQIALADLQMPNVTIQFNEIVRTTGELKSCFRFTSKGHEYFTLSLSERIKAGIEVAAMLRGITGYDYPLFIDNSESIGGLSNYPLPNQTIFMKYVQGAEIAVRYQDKSKRQESLAA